MSIITQTHCNLLTVIQSLEVGEVVVHVSNDLRIEVCRRSEDCFMCKLSEDSNRTDYDISERIFQLPDPYKMDKKDLYDILKETMKEMISVQNERDINILDNEENRKYKFLGIQKSSFVVSE